MNRLPPPPVSNHLPKGGGGGAGHGPEDLGEVVVIADAYLLREAFFQFRQYSQQEIQAYTETLEALSAYIRLKGMILTTEQTDTQTLFCRKGGGRGTD